MAFSIITVLLLVVHEVFDLVVLLTTEDEVSRLGLHVIEDAVDVHKGSLIVWTSLDQLLREKLTGLSVCAVANVALPEAKDLADEVVFEEVHRGEHVEHGLLLHPV